MTLFAQKEKFPDVYDWNWAIDGPIMAVGIAGTGYGTYLIAEKEGITEAELAEIVASQGDINGLDSWAIGNINDDSELLSDYPFLAGMALPVLLGFDKNINDDAFKILGLYVESIGLTGSFYSISAGLINRSRPYVYSEEADLGRRTNSNGQRSFYSGHVAVTANGFFFTAKVLNDYYPDLRAKGLIWGAAAVLPAAVGYWRIESGRHFLTDVLLGYGMGAATGILVPHFHKKENSQIGFQPSTKLNLLGDSYQGIALRYRF